MAKKKKGTTTAFPGDTGGAGGGGAGAGRTVDDQENFVKDEELEADAEAVDPAGGMSFSRGVGLQKTTSKLNHTTDVSRPLSSCETNYNDATLAAVNPDMVGLQTMEYQNLYNPRLHWAGSKSTGWWNIHSWRVIGERPEGATLTFKSLASWELWARTDPMNTGNMRYEVEVIPSDAGGGDVDMWMCNWAKPGSRNQLKYGVAPACSITANDAPWMQGKDEQENPKCDTTYRRAHGKNSRLFRFSLESHHASPVIRGGKTPKSNEYHNRVRDRFQKVEAARRKMIALQGGDDFEHAYTYMLYAVGDKQSEYAKALGAQMSIPAFVTRLGTNLYRHPLATIAAYEAQIASDMERFTGSDALGDKPTAIKLAGTGSGIKEKSEGQPDAHQGVWLVFAKPKVAKLKWTKKIEHSLWEHEAFAATVMSLLAKQAPTRQLKQLLTKHARAANNRKKAATRKMAKAQKAYNHALALLAVGVVDDPADAEYGDVPKAKATMKDAQAVTECDTEPINKDGSFNECLGIASNKGGPVGGWNSIAKNYDTDADGLLWKTEYEILSIKGDDEFPKVGQIRTDIAGTTFEGLDIGGNPTPEIFTPLRSFCSEGDSLSLSTPDDQGGPDQTGNGNQFPAAGSESPPVVYARFGTFGGHPGQDRDGGTGKSSPTGQDPAPSFLTQDGCNNHNVGAWPYGPKCAASFGITASGYHRLDYAIYGFLTPSLAPARPYDPDQKPEGLGIMMVPTPPSGIGIPGKHHVRQPSEDLHGNSWNGNDIRIIKNCRITAFNGSAINCKVAQRTEDISQSGTLLKRKGHISRTMTVLMQNNVIIHKFAAHAYPTESGIYRQNQFFNNVSTDVSHEPIVTTLGGTYVQSNRTLTASGSFGTNLPSWVKRHSKVIFHANHACSGVEYKVDQRVNSSSLILNAAVNPGSNVGPGAFFELRPKLYHGPTVQQKASWMGYEMSPITIKNQAINGGQLEVWMQNNTIMAHPDACVNENNTYYGALRQGHGYGPGTSGHIKSFDAKYIAIANITQTRPVITNPSGTFLQVPNGQKAGANTGFLQSHININMENNLICPVYNARLPSGKTYADDETANSPKWDVVSDIGIPVVNVRASGCLITHCSVKNNVIVGRSYFDSTKKQYVQHPDDGDNILAAMDYSGNTGTGGIIASGSMGYRKVFASGFSVYNGGPDDVFRSFFGPFYGDNVSDENVSVTGRGDYLDSFIRQNSHAFQHSLNDGVLFNAGTPPTIIHTTFAGIPPEAHSLPRMDSPYDFNDVSIYSYGSTDLESKIPNSVLRDKNPGHISKPDVFKFGEKGVIDVKTDKTLRSVSATSHRVRGGWYVGATVTNAPGKKPRKYIPAGYTNTNIFCTVGQKRSNIKNGSYVNIDNGFSVLPFTNLESTAIHPDVLQRTNTFLPFTDSGIRVSSGGKNDKPIIAMNDLGNLEMHLGQTRDNIIDEERVESNIDKLFDRFKSQDGHGTQ